MATAFREDGSIEEVPDVDEEAVAVWRRFGEERAGGGGKDETEKGPELEMAVWSGAGKEEGEEEGGVSVGAGTTGGEVEMEMGEGRFAPPEPVSETDSE